MMESSPLILAHDHARAAAVATHSSDTTVAINEHALAAGEFANAASGTGSAEALRTLRLLEQHHQRLSELLRYPAENPPNTNATEGEVQTISEKPLSTSAAVAELRASKSDLGPASSSPSRNPPSLQYPRRLPPRDLSSSIASNLASARGIRANYTRQPLSPSISTQQAPGSLEALPRKRSHVPASIPEHSQPSWVPPKAVAPPSIESQVAASSTVEAANNDEGFSRFYNTFENILSKLSAPLAFAGLPLITEDAAESAVTEPTKTIRKRPQSKDRSNPEPDLSKFISRAALRATTHGHSGNDSFYVVPTSGHTASYAQILSFDQKEQRRLAVSMHAENSDLFPDPEEDDFVDARETPMPVSPAASRRFNGRKPQDRALENKVEELDTENKSLKDCIDKLSKRLHAFESTAQQSTINLQRMHQSMKISRTMSPGREPLGQGGDEALKNKVFELQEHVAASGKEIERLARENNKLREVVDRYRDRWEKLKAGAKTRRDGGQSKDVAPKDPPLRRDNPPGGGRFMAG